MEVLGRAQVSMRDAPDPRVNLEVALVRLAHPEADDSPEALLARIERLEAAGRSVPDRAPVPDHLPPVAPAPAPVAAPVAPAPAPAPRPTAPAPAAPGTDDSPSAAATGADAGSGPKRPRTTLGAVRRQSPPPVAGAPAAAAPTAPAADATNAPAAPPSDDPPAEPGNAVAFPTRDQLVQAWGDHIIGRLRPKAKALFQAGRFVGVEGERAVFGLPNEIHRVRCEEVRGEIEAALGEHFGRPVPLTLVVDAGAGSDAGPGEAAVGSTGRPPTSSTSPPVPASTGTAATGAMPPVPPPGAGHASPGAGSGAGAPDDVEDLEAFDESELGEVADFDNSVTSRVLKAFPGAEEVG
jgi:DNA polymerase-3 subunit gamma/tau